MLKGINDRDNALHVICQLIDQTEVLMQQNPSYKLLDIQRGLYLAEALVRYSSQEQRKECCKMLKTFIEKEYES